jgi:hypothetical protein
MTHAARRLTPALLLALAFPAAADTIISHGISAFGELKYPPDFPHFDYVNPDAPKGGFMSFRGTGASQTFDSLNAFILKGEPAQGLERLYDSLLVRAYDEPDAVYGLLAEKIEYPETGPGSSSPCARARFADGHPVTAEDVVFTFTDAQGKGRARYQIDLEDVAAVTRSPRARSASTSREGARTRDLIANVGEPTASSPHITTRPCPSTSRRSTRRSARGPMSSPRRSRPLDHLLPERGLLGRGPAGEPRPQQLRLLPLRVLRRQYRRLRGAEGGRLPLPRGELLGEWATGYDFPALSRGMGRQGGDPRRPSLGRAGLLVQHAAREVPGPPRARGHRHDVQLRMVERDAVLRPLRPHRQLLGELLDAGRGPA